MGKKINASQSLLITTSSRLHSAQLAAQGELHIVQPSTLQMDAWVGTCLSGLPLGTPLCIACQSTTNVVLQLHSRVVVHSQRNHPVNFHSNKYNDSTLYASLQKQVIQQTWGENKLIQLNLKVTVQSLDYAHTNIYVGANIGNKRKCGNNFQVSLCEQLIGLYYNYYWCCSNFYRRSL